MEGAQAGDVPTATVGQTGGEVGASARGEVRTDRQPIEGGAAAATPPSSHASMDPSHPAAPVGTTAVEPPGPRDGKAALEQRGVSRVEAFSDGVFAFAITLLVLGIRIPRPSDADASTGLHKLLLQQWPSYATFALTFAVVGTVWANHRLVFSHLVRSDHVLVSLNLLELMCVAFLPVPTAVLGAWVASDRNRLAAVLFYGGTLVLLGIFHNLLWWYGGYWGRLTSPDLTERKRRALTLTWLGGPALYGASLALALIDPRLSIAGFAALEILFLLPTPRVLMLARRTRGGRRSD